MPVIIKIVGNIAIYQNELENANMKQKNKKPVANPRRQSVNKLANIEKRLAVVEHKVGIKQPANNSHVLSPKTGIIEIDI